MVRKSPPPMPMLWGFIRPTHSSDAMQASTAEPCFFRMLLWKLKPENIRGRGRNMTWMCNTCTMRRRCSHMPTSEHGPASAATAAL